MEQDVKSLTATAYAETTDRDLVNSCSLVGTTDVKPLIDDSKLEEHIETFHDVIKAVNALESKLNKLTVVPIDALSASDGLTVITDNLAFIMSNYTGGIDKSKRYYFSSFDSTVKAFCDKEGIQYVERLNNEYEHMDNWAIGTSEGNLIGRVAKQLCKIINSINNFNCPDSAPTYKKVITSTQTVKA